MKGFREINEIKNEEKSMNYTKIGSGKVLTDDDVDELSSFWREEFRKASEEK